MRRFLVSPSAFALLAATLMGSAQPSSAQFFGFSWERGFGPPPVVYEDAIPPRAVASILRARGFFLAEPPERRGPVIYAVGEDGRGQLTRFLLDARDGTILRSALVGAPRPPGYIAGEQRSYVTRAPGLDPIEPQAVVPALPGEQKPKPKPKPKAVAKAPPAPVSAPPAASAPPVVAAPPSTASKAPEPVIPAAPAPVEATATIPPAKPVESKPAEAKPTESKPAEAKPAEKPVAAHMPAATSAPARSAPAAATDIGPKVVPVSPQTRAPAPAEPPTP